MGAWVIDARGGGEGAPPVGDRYADPVIGVDQVGAFAGEVEDGEDARLEAQLPLAVERGGRAVEREGLAEADGASVLDVGIVGIVLVGGRERSEEHTSELQSLMRISYAVVCFKKKSIN